MSRESAMSVLTGTPAPAPLVAVATEGAPPVEAPKQVTSADFAHLAKKEAEVVRQREENKAAKAALEKEKADAQAILTKEQEFRALRSKDPLAALKMMGFSEQDIFNYLAENQPVELTPEQKAAKAAEEAAKSTIDSWEKAQAEKQAKERKERDDAVISSFKTSIAPSLEKDKEKYKFCIHNNEEAHDLIYKTVLASVEQSKGEEIISLQQANDLVETYYREKFEHDRAAFDPTPLKTPPEVLNMAKTTERTRTITNQKGEVVPNTPVKPRTLSNAVRASSTAAAPVPRNESKEQKRERLIKALHEGKLS